MVVLLIYENLIAVETSLVQTKSIINKTKHIKNHTPMADRLDRNYLGVDQDYYEKIPLLINDLQESYTDILDAPEYSSRKKYRSTIDQFKPAASTVNNIFVRRTSPKPFVFQYKSPYPMPFSKTSANPKHWLEQYKYIQRLKNLRSVVKYLEKTLNAKFSDFYIPSEEQIAFTRVYITPSQNDNIKSAEKSENSYEKFDREKTNHNHHIDPLLVYKPDSPGDVNLLADGLRFAPSVTKPSEMNNIPLESAAENVQTNCRHGRCSPYNRNILKNYFLPNSEGFRSAHLSLSNVKPKSFSHHSASNPMFTQESQENKNDFDKIYITTSQPILFQFRRKPNISNRRYLQKDKSLRPDERRKTFFSSSFRYDKNTTSIANINPIVMNDKILTDNEKLNILQAEKEFSKFRQQDLMERNTMSNIPTVALDLVEDYHVGSSGVIPVDAGTTETYSAVTPVLSFRPYTETIITSPPDIIKFSPEDAKIPDQYFNPGISKSDQVTESETIWRNFESTKLKNDAVETETLIVKLRNTLESTTKENLEDAQEYDASTTEEAVESTTWTYVPMINGHYRNVKNKTLTLLHENSEKYRKKRLETLLATRNSTYIPMYVEIIRNRNINVHSDNN